MALDFPSGVTIGYVYTYGGRSWTWNGSAWDVYTSTTFVNTLNGFTGGVTLSGGTYINISSSGGIITISSPGDGPSGYVSSFNGLAGAVTGVGSFNGKTGDVQGVSSWNGQTGAITFVNYVTTFNGLTGAVTGVTTGTANNFVALQSFSTGISASGGSAFNSNVSFTSTTSHTGLASFAGISASGGVTFAGNVAHNSTTFHTGLADFAGGISASNGMTLNGTMVLNGQTFSNLVSSVNGYTGAVGGWLTHPGFTTSAPVYNDSTSSGTKTIYYLPTYYVSQSDWSSYTVQANRSYFSLFNTNKALTIKTIRSLTNATVTTGNAYISVYSADPNTGLPSTRLYNSASLAVGSNYTGISVTNSSGLVTVPAGFFYVSATFSSTPIMFAPKRNSIPAIYGASSYSAGTTNLLVLADYSGFTTAASLPASGVTLGYMENTANGNYAGIVMEIAI